MAGEKVVQCPTLAVGVRDAQFKVQFHVYATEGRFKLTEASADYQPILRRQFFSASRRRSADTWDRYSTGRQILRELDQCIEAILWEFSPRASQLGPEFINAVRRFLERREGFPSTKDVRRLLSFTKSWTKRCDRAAARTIVQLGGVLLQRLALQQVVASGIFREIKNKDPEVRPHDFPSPQMVCRFKRSELRDGL